MKRLLFILSVITICSCKAPCLLGQYQNQLIFANSNCVAIIPDFTLKAMITGGCTGFTVLQIPEAGTIVTTNTPMIIRAISPNGKVDQVNFMAIFTDTVTPKITFPLADIDTLLKKSNQLYDIADNMVGLIDSLSNTYPGAVYEDVLRTKVFMVTSVLNDEGQRQRTITFHDTLSVPLFSAYGDSVVVR